MALLAVSRGWALGLGEAWRPHEAVAVTQPLPPQPPHPGGLPHREAAEHLAGGQRSGHVLGGRAGEAEHLTQLPLDLGVPVAVKQGRERGVEGGRHRDHGGDEGGVTQHLDNETVYSVQRSED